MTDIKFLEGLYKDMLGRYPVDLPMMIRFKQVIGNLKVAQPHECKCGGNCKNKK